jgi:hypothetical protein
MGQLSFFAQLREPGERWVQVREDSGHRVYEPGDRFLVVEDGEERNGYLLCWKDGQPPSGYPRIRGFVIHEKYIEEVNDERGNDGHAGGSATGAVSGRDGGVG